MRPNLVVRASIALILSATSLPCAAELVEVANSVRSQGCAEYDPVDNPLRMRTQLDNAAQRLAEGDNLRAATKASGYRAKASASIRIRTTGSDERVARILAQRFCDIIADPTLSEIGVFRDGAEVWMVLATPQTRPNPDDARAIGERVLELINQARQRERRCGRKKFLATTQLKWAESLEQAALAHARDMAARGEMSHNGADGSKPAERATRAGYAWASVAENVAAGQSTAEEVVNTWLKSAGHCANLMSPRYSETGVAFAINPGDEKGTYWVQLFAAPE